ncbi:autotransporter-associated beta strand repeat-containing protein [Acetobacter pasteurianus]|uniref:autotransporter-associated beta strand repeat-containing protein n=1 Tax=Acetobacter pasteurianus TaxID=438 RepID=UPI001364644B|nr:autotransporter-associated beta strand repeat-containing protein [Acetobacter pasteurianus]QHM90250.1 autotransporter-associated beta strand repeat-containing protein [Acetobacter pasteurianus]
MPVLSPSSIPTIWEEIQDLTGPKTGDGSLTLTSTGLNTYTGKTEVQDGVLYVYLGSDALYESSDVDIDKSGTLSVLYRTSDPVIGVNVKSLDGSGAITTNANNPGVYVGLEDASGNYSGNASTEISIASGTEIFGGGTVDGLESSSNADIVISANGEQDIIPNQEDLIEGSLVLDGALNIQGIGNASALFVDGEVKGSGELNISGASGEHGFVFLTGERNYTGLTTIDSNGFLAIYDRDAQVSGNMASSKIIDNGVLCFISSPDINDVQTLSAPISGDGDLVAIGETLSIKGKNTLTGTNYNESLLEISVGLDGNFEGSSIVASGSSIITSSNGLGQGNVALFSNSNLDISQNYDALISNTIFDSGSKDGSVSKDGTGNVTLNGHNTYGGGTTINEGGLTAGNNSAFGSGAITMADGTELSYASDGLSLSNIFQLNGKSSINVQSDQSDILTGVIGDGSSSGTLIKIGAGTLSLLGANTYTGGTDIASGSIAINGPSSLGTGSVEMDEGTSLSFLSDGTNLSNNITLSGDPTFDVQSGNTDTESGVISNGSEAGDLVKTGSGTLNLKGNNTYTGTTEVFAGTLDVDGDASASTGQVSVDSGAGLGGTGTIGGSVDIAEGATLAAGDAGQVGTLTIDGGLTLENGSTTLFDLGQAGTEGGAQNDLIKVGGDLTLGGTIDVNADPTSGSTLSEGVYRLFDYAGTLSGSTALSSTLPINVGDASQIQTSISGQVNLVVYETADNLWNGSTTTAPQGVLNGGSGIWNASNTNWADVALQSDHSWDQGENAVFSGSAGSVTVDDSLAQISVASMDFENSDGAQYVIQGDKLQVAGSSLSVGVSDDNSAEIDSVITEASGTPSTLVKTGGGTLTLGGDNSFSGGTDIQNGTIILSDQDGLGTGGANIESGSHLSVVLSGGGAISNILSGGGDLTFAGQGVTTISGDETITGQTSIKSGTLLLGSGAGLEESSDVDVASGASLDTSGNDFSIKSLSGEGEVESTGHKLTLTSASGVFSGNFVGDGDLAIAAGEETLQNVSGDISSLEVGSSAKLNIDSSTLANANLETEGGAQVTVASTDQFAGLSGSGEVQLDNASTLNLLGKNDETFSGQITGSGELVIGDGVGVGSQTLTAGNDEVANDWSGSIDINPEASLIVDNPTGGVADIPSGMSIEDNGLLEVVNASKDGQETLAAQISGTGTLETSGNIDLTATINTLDGSKPNTGVPLGTSLVAENGVVTGDTKSLGTGNIVLDGATLDLKQNENATISRNIGDQSSSLGQSGDGSLIKDGAGALTLSGTNTYTGSTDVTSGDLLVDGDSSGATGQVNVGNGATLGGTGTIGGNVDIAGGATLAAGDAGQVGTLTIDGGLTLESGSTTDFELGQAGTEGGAQNDLIKVGGDLTLGGTIDVTADPTSGTTLSEGVYRLFDYSGALSGSTALSSTLPINAGDAVGLQTAIDGEVNLVVYSTAQAFWNGSGKDNGILTGGDGTWNSTNPNWTDANADVNAEWSSGRAAIFEGQSGNVVVDDSQGNISVSAIQFSNTDGGIYRITGDEIDASGNSISVNVGDGVPSGSTITAEIDSAIEDGATGTSKVVKEGLGTLILGGNNGYTGGTDIEAGTLELTSSSALGSGSVLDNASVVANVGVHAISEISNNLNGTGSFTKEGAGTLILSGSDTLTGSIDVQGGKLTIADNASPTDASIEIGNGTQLDVSGTDVSTKSITGEGSVYLGDKTLTLTDASGLISGEGEISGGTLSIESGQEVLDGTDANQTNVEVGSLGAISLTDGAAVGSVTDDGGSVNLAGNVILTGALNGYGSVTFDDSQTDTLYICGLSGQFSGTITGEGTLNLLSGASQTLSGENVWSGGIEIGDEAALTVADTTDHAANLPETGNIDDEGSLIIKNSSGHSTSITGNIDGKGALEIDGGEASLEGDNGYSGGLTVSNADVVANTASVGTGSIALENGAILDISQNTDGILSPVVSGDGSVEKTGDGNVTLAAANSYAGGTEIDGGSLIGSASSFGSGSITDNSSLIVSDDDDSVLSNTVSGTGSLTKSGNSELTLAGENDFSGGLNIQDGSVKSSVTGLGSGSISDNGSLDISQDANASLSNTISGSGSVQKTGAGTLTLTGSNAYSGTTEVAAGTLNVDGDSSGVTGQVSVDSGAALGGTGTIGGSVDIAGGATLAAGDAGQAGTLTIDGGLTLESGSTTDFDLGKAGTEGGAQNDLIKVGGDLTLGGTIDVNADPTSGTTLSEGVYRLFDYAGSLSGSTALSSTLPINAGDEASLQTSIDGQVNLVVFNGSQLFWNGSGKGNGVLSGGSGTWNETSNPWTDSAANAQTNWIDGRSAIFEGQAGNIVVDDSEGNISVGSMQFANTDGGTYDVTGDAISASGSSLNVDVGDGSSSGADIKAEIAASITDGAKGPAGLIKSGQGTLVMDGSNTYSGGTQIESGVLEITNSAALGTGAVDDQTSLLVDVTGKSELANDISGSGSLTKTGSGDIVLSGKDTLSGGINVQEGTLAIGVNASPIDSDVNISSGASLDTSIGDVGTKSISGAGTVNLGAKSLTLSDASGQFSGQITGNGSLDVLSGSEGLIGVQANQATVQIENAASVDTGNGSTVGSILDNGGIISVAGNTTLGTLNGTGSVSLTGQNSELEIDGKGGVFSGAIEGSGVVKLDDGASETLGGNNAVTGEIDIGKEASLTIADGSTHSATLPSANTIQDDGSLTVENKEPGHVTTIKAAINGSGAINVVGGETVLTGQNGFTGGVKVSDATLEASTSNLGKGSVELDADSLLNIDQSTDNGLTNTISGEGKVVKSGVGNVTLTGENDYSGGTEIKSGSLIGSAGSFGSGAIEDDSQLTVSQNEDGVMDNSITGTGSVTKTGDADLTLSGQNDFSGGLNVAAGTLTASSESLGSGNITDDSDIELSQDQDGQISDNISGSGVVQKTGSGTLTLSGTDSHSGGTEVAAGTLNVDGDSSASTGQVSVDSGAGLGGTGTIGGSVDIAGGATLAAGDAGQVGTLTIDGGLTLESGSTTDFDLGQAGTEGGAQNDLIKVGGDLTLGGTIDVNADPTSGTTLSEGVYRLFDYAGTLSGEASINGSLPIAAGDAAALQTSVNGQVNLVVANMSTEIWNGSIDTTPSGTLTGGDGVWKGGVTNWTNIDADVSGVWNPGSTAIFEAQAGRVSIDDKSGNVSVGAMDFANSDGQSYIISGDTLYAAGQSLKVNVGDGATSGSSITAEIDSSISDANVVGGSKLVKDGLGTLVLGGDNTLTDGIDIEGGSLDITNAKSTGKGAITDNAALNIDLAGDGQIGNDITGAGTVRKSGSNTVVLSGENNYSGGTDIEAGTLKGSVGNFGSGAIMDNATLDIDQSSDASLANKISGTGDVIKDGAGDLTLSGVNSYSGSTVIKSGVLTASVGSMGSGEIVDDATLNVDQNVTGVLSNELSGNGTLIKSGDGVLQLTGSNSLSGEIDIQSGTLELDTKSSGQAEIEDQATLALNQADDGILGNAISGSGGIVKEGAGSVTLAGNNSFTGGIDIEAGDITTGVNNLGTGKVLDNATLTLSQSKDGELKNVISGKGKVVKAGSNTLTLASQNTWTGGTDIQSGTLSGNTSSFGSGSIEDDASLEVTANGDSTFSNTVSGSGDVEYNITGDDTLNVTSINSYSGGTDIQGGTVKGDAGSFGSGQIVDNGTLEIDQTSNSSMANNISGSGELVKDGAGDLTLTGTNTYSGGTDIEAGTLTAGTQNLGTGDITNNATLDLKQDYDGTLSGQISGAGTVIKEGIGDVTLQDTNTYTGGTDVIAGTLTGTITSFGTGKIIVAEGAKVNIDQKDDPVMSNDISGAGVIEKSDTGTVIMSGKDTHTGGTIVTGGTLVTDASNLAGGNVVNNAKLVINQSSSATLASQITGSGSLVKEGSGTLDITGDTSGMTGTTKVLGGTLNVETNASNSDVTTVSGSTLAGQGSVGDTTIQNGATLSPAGNSIGTLHVAGNLVLENGSEMVSTTDGKATDLVDVKGNAIVSGVAEMFTNSSQNKNLPYGQTFTILHANGGVTGRFGSFTTNLESAYPFLTPGLTYTSNDVNVSLVRDTEVPFSSFAQTRNQKAVAASLDETSLNNSIVQQIEQQSAPQARQSYDSLSGEIRASVKTDLIQDTQLIRNAAFNRMASAECDMSVGNISTADPKSGQKMQGGACDTGMVLWGEGFGDHGHNGGSGGSADMKHSAAGFIMGLDAPINNTNIRVGGLVSYSHDRFSVKDGRSSSGSANNLTVGGYASTHWERLMLRAGATYTWNMVNTNRNVSVGSIHERDSGHSLGGTAQAFAELGYRFDVGDYAVEPFGQIAYVNQDFMGSREHGGSAALKTHGADTGVTFATFGARASHTFRLKGIDLNAFGSASYRHAFGGLTPTARQVYAGGTDMDVAGTPLAANSAVVEAGVSYKVGKNIDVGLSYTGQFGQKYRDNAINGHVRVQW